MSEAVRAALLVEEICNGIVSDEFFARYQQRMGRSGREEVDFATAVLGRVGRWARRVIATANRPVDRAKLSRLIRDMPRDQRRTFAHLVLGPAAA